MLEKNKEYILDIVDNGIYGEGIAKYEDYIVFIPTAIKNEKIKTLILKVDKNIAYGKVIEILKESNHRRKIDCRTFPKCGGCHLRHVEYDYSLEIKKNAVEMTFRKALRRDLKIDEIIKMDNPIFYRNKLQYPVGLDKTGTPRMGVFQERSHQIIDTRVCFIQDETSQDIANSIYFFILENNIKVYNEKNLTGSIRHIVIRSGNKTNEYMVTIVTNEENIEKEDELIASLLEKYPNIKTIVKNINNKDTNVILGEKNIVLYGDGFIEDYIGEFKFKISPMSFYQVNPIQTEKLYSKAIEYANLTGKETIFDLYCGIGTIGIFASKKVKNIYGIEVIKEAIEDAKNNAKLNNIENAEYMVGTVEQELPDFIKKNNIKPDVIFVDPPRKGCDKSAIDTMLEIGAKKIVYVSCNPATLARDLVYFEQKYDIKKVAICDMFPYTYHIESVVLLELK